MFPGTLVRLRGKSVEQMRSLQETNYAIHFNSAKKIDDNNFEVPAELSDEQIAELKKKDFEVIPQDRMEALAMPEDTTTERAGPGSGPEQWWTVNDINNVILSYPKTYAGLVTCQKLPNRTANNKESYFLHIGKGATKSVFIIGGVHARELMTPEICIDFAYWLLEAAKQNKGLQLGNYIVPAADINSIINNLNVIVFPLVNPDGREWALSSNRSWRKNRNAQVGGGAIGVDINRNYDILWDSGIGTSPDPNQDNYRGSKPNSEPETQNVKYILDSYPNIRCMIDLHSSGKQILHPWSDDDIQTDKPNQNFRERSYDGRRGMVIADPAFEYKEYMPPADLPIFQQLGTSMQKALRQCRGTTYIVKPSFNALYPTSGSSDDYAYSRHLVPGSGKRKVFSYTVECGDGMQPAQPERTPISKEVCSAFFQLCLDTMKLAIKSEEVEEAVVLA